MLAFMLRSTCSNTWATLLLRKYLTNVLYWFGTTNKYYSRIILKIRNIFEDWKWSIITSNMRLVDKIHDAISRKRLSLMGSKINSIKRKKVQEEMRMVILDHWTSFQQYYQITNRRNRIDGKIKYLLKYLSKY